MKDSVDRMLENKAYDSTLITGEPSVLKTVFAFSVGTS
jgi:hypothetical protein